MCITSEFLGVRFGRKDPISHSGFAEGKSVGRVDIDNVQDLFVNIFGECSAGAALVTIYVMREGVTRSRGFLGVDLDLKILSDRGVVTPG